MKFEYVLISKEKTLLLFKTSIGLYILTSFNKMEVKVILYEISQQNTKLAYY